MADEHGREWIKVPDDRVEELGLPEGQDDVRGYADDPYFKMVGGTTYVLQGSPYAVKLSLGGDLFFK